jgi:MinD superfamily P-loop ATPase
MKIVFASGKGGTGKTTIAANLAWLLAHSGQRVQYVDCDVEEPNGYLFLKPAFERSEPARVMVPLIDAERCTSCGQCGKACQFHAIVNLPGQTLLLPQMCHGCGLCTLVCPERAISDETREIGWIEKGSAILNIPFVHGMLNVGEPMAGPLIEQVKAHAIDGHIAIIDAPPGTSCPVVKTMKHADLVILVTEPTPFGLHDLRAAIIVARSLAVPVAVVVNRERTRFEQLERYLRENGLPVLVRIPDDRRIAREYSMGNLICETLPVYREHFRELVAGIGRVSTLSERGREWRIAKSL